MSHFFRDSLMGEIKSEYQYDEIGRLIFKETTFGVHGSQSLTISYNAIGLIEKQTSITIKGVKTTMLFEYLTD